MNKPEWTPGPWRINRVSITSVEALEGRSTAACGGYQNLSDASFHEENEANARLCAAAPELYDALNQIVETWDHSGRTEGFNDALAVLDKARGE